jgi:small conductance mechanosensitive channel
VTAVDIFETKIVGFDGVPALLPNKKVREGQIRNYSRAERRRIEMTVGVAYGADVNEAIQTILRTLSDDERVFDEPEPIVNVSALADSSVNILVRFWISPTGWIPNHMDVRRKLKLALDDAGISIPFPQRVVTMVKDEAA